MFNTVIPGGTKSRELLEVQLKMLQCKFNEGATMAGALTGCAAEFKDLAQNNEPLPEVQRCLNCRDNERWSAARYRDEGFKAKSLAAQSKEIWTEEEKEKVEQALRDYAENKEEIYQHDPFGYLSRQTLGNSKTSEQVEVFLTEKYNV